MTLYTSECLRVPNNKARRGRDGVWRRVQLPVYFTKRQATRIWGACNWAFRSTEAFRRSPDKFARRAVMSRLAHIERGIRTPVSSDEVNVAPLPVSNAAIGSDRYFCKLTIWLTEEERLRVKKAAIRVYPTRTEYKQHGCAGMAHAIIMDFVQKAEREMRDAGWSLKKAREVGA